MLADYARVGKPVVPHGAIPTPASPSPRPPEDIYAHCVVTVTTRARADAPVYKVLVRHYNAKSQVTSEREFAADGSLRLSSEHKYDSDGRLLSLFGYKSEGVRTGGIVYGYDRWKRLVTISRYIRDELVSVNRLTYDLRGRLIWEASDNDFDGIPDGGMTHYTYDSIDRRIGKTIIREGDGLRDSVFYYVWKGSLLIEYGVREGDRAVFEYDESDRLVRSDFVDGVEGISTNHVTFTYHPEGQVAEVVVFDRGGVYQEKEYSYDELGRLIRMSYSHHFYGTTVEDYTYACAEGG